MTEHEKITARLENTEKTLFAVITVLMGLQPPDTQDDPNQIMRDYYAANWNTGDQPDKED